MKGNKDDDGKPRHDLLDYDFVTNLAEVLSFGARKYGDHNWRGGIKTSRLFSALQRHLTAFWGGEDIDKESGLSHLSHAAANLMMLQATLKDKPSMDDRYGKKEDNRQSKYFGGLPNCS